MTPGRRRRLGAPIFQASGRETEQAALAIRQGLGVTGLGAMIFPYLTTVAGLKRAARTFEKDVSKLSCRAGKGHWNGRP